MAAQVPTVAVIAAARADLSSDLILTAEFEPFQEVDVMAKVSGYIRQMKVDIGDKVKGASFSPPLKSPRCRTT